MENYRIYFEKGEEEEIITILKDMSDVLIDGVSEKSIGITIKGTNPKKKYIKLLDVIDQYVFSFRSFNRFY